MKQIDALKDLKPKEEGNPLEDKSNNQFFYDYKDSKDLFNAIKNCQIKSSEAKNKQNEFLSKLII